MFRPILSIGIKATTLLRYHLNIRQQLLTTRGFIFLNNLLEVSY